MTQTRRELLASLGIASASTLLWACGGASRVVREPPQLRDEVRSWLRDAVTRLAAVYPTVHVLAVTRRRTTAAVDVIGTGVARARRDGVVIVVRDRAGHRREEVTSELTAAGVATAVRALIGTSAQIARVPFPEPARAPRAPRVPEDIVLEKRVNEIMRNDSLLNSRIVYAAAIIDVDDARVWSISPHHDREQHLVRVRKRAIRAAWAGTRPVVTEAERGWIGGIDDNDLGRTVEDATAAALLLTTPGTFADGERDVVLDPSVTASLIDAGARVLLTTTAARRPEVAQRLAIGANLAAPMVSIVDDPTVPGVYGGYQFDDEGQPAAPLPLLDGGRVVGILADGGGGRGLRPGHLGVVEPAPSHLRLAPGTVAATSLRGDGYLIEGSQSATIDPSSGRVVLTAARARELKGGVDTGRVFADVELVGSLASLLANVRGVSKESETISYRDEVDGEPRWRSIEAPHLSTRGLVRMRWRRT